MTAEKYFLAIDIGASSGRHILACIQNEKLVFEEIYRFENHFGNDNGSLVWGMHGIYGAGKISLNKKKRLTYLSDAFFYLPVRLLLCLWSPGRNRWQQ